MNSSFAQFTLDQAEDHIGRIIMAWPSGGGMREVELQRAELAGTIESMMFFGMIKETTRAVLNAMYVQGWSKKEALRQFGNIKKVSGTKKKAAQNLEEHPQILENKPEDVQNQGFTEISNKMLE